VDPLPLDRTRQSATVTIGVLLVGFKTADVVPLVARLVHQQLQREPYQEGSAELLSVDATASRNAQCESNRQDQPLGRVSRPGQHQIAQQ
jgi:hypothetical protein